MGGGGWGVGWLVDPLEKKTTRRKPHSSCNHSNPHPPNALTYLLTYLLTYTPQSPPFTPSLTLLRLHPTGAGWGLFGLHTVGKDAREVVLTEGEFDAMAVYQVGGNKAFSVFFNWAWGTRQGFFFPIISLGGRGFVIVFFSAGERRGGETNRPDGHRSSQSHPTNHQLLFFSFLPGHKSSQPI